MLATLALLGLFSPAEAQVPARQIPPSVLVELHQLENRFELALAQDCDADRCFSKGCAYGDHAVADQPKSASLPGLADEAGPRAADAQEYLTQARCSFAHEQALEAGDVQALVRRLQAKLSTGWTSVSIDRTVLQPLPEYMREAPTPVGTDTPEAAPEPVVELAPEEPVEWATTAVAGRELWTTLLPHFYWMIGLALASMAGMVLIWSWRRVGKDSLEDQALFAQLTSGEDGDDAGLAAPAVVEEGPTEAEYVAQQEQLWAARFADRDPDQAHPELDALFRGLLRTGDLPLLAKAVLHFPAHLPAAFPDGTDVAAAKLDLAAFLKDAEEDRLPSDVDFFVALNRHALAASLSAQGDAEMLRSLREDFGATGLAQLVQQLPPRAGALLFALAQPADQHEIVRMLSTEWLLQLSLALMLSNRMDPDEAAHLFAALRASRAGAPLPPAPPNAVVSDRGTVVDAAGALSILLSALPPEHQGTPFQQLRARKHFGGPFPAWFRGILSPAMLLALPTQSRSDLFLDVAPELVAAWISLRSADDRAELMADLPASLQASLDAASRFADRSVQLSLAARGREALGRAMHGQLARLGVDFDQVALPSPAAE